MKTSTLLTMVTLSASCFAAPVHTAPDGPTASSLAERANAAPVAPAAPGVAATGDISPQQWEVATSRSQLHRAKRAFADLTGSTAVSLARLKSAGANCGGRRGRRL